MPRQISGSDLAAALMSDEGLAPVVTLTGLVKAGDSKDWVVFAPGSACRNWRSIPVSLIDTVEVLGQQACDDHEHPSVRLTLTAPADDEAKALFDLLRLAVESPTVPGGLAQPGLTDLLDPVDCAEKCTNAYDEASRRCGELERPMDQAICCAAASFAYGLCLKRCIQVLVE